MFSKVAFVLLLSIVSAIIKSGFSWTINSVFGLADDCATIGNCKAALGTTENESRPTTLSPASIAYKISVIPLVIQTMRFTGKVMFTLAP